MSALRSCCNVSKNVSALLTKSTTTTSQINSNLIRCFSSSSSIQGRGITEKGKRKVQAKHDAKLRHAIDLYHTSQHFYPTRATITGQRKIDLISSEDLQEYSTEQEEDERLILRSFDEEIDWIVRANLFITRRSKSDESIHIHEPVTMRSGSVLYDHIEKKRTTAESSEQKSFIDTVTNTFYGMDSSALKSFSQLELPLPDENDSEAVKSYIAEAVKRASLASSHMHGEAPQHSGKDSRSLRIRDALFGTVQGSLPGLEVIRERSNDPRVQEEAKRLIKEAKEARDRRSLQEQTTPESKAASSPSAQ